MSIYYVINDGGKDTEPAFLCSNHGWGDVCRYADDLDEKYNGLRHLTEYGWNEPGTKIADAVALVLKDEADIPDTIKSVLEDLRIAADGEDGFFRMSDGTVIDDADEE